MAKSKNKNKDFNKTKLKVGKKPDAPSSFTKTDFKAKALDIKVRNVPQTLDAAERIKILIKQSTRCKGSQQIDSLVKLEKLCRTEKQFIQDNSDYVRELLGLWVGNDALLRSKALGLFKTLFTHIDIQQMDAFFPEIMAKLNMSLNHIDTGIRYDALKFFDLIVDHYDGLVKSNFKYFFKSLIDVIRYKKSMNTSNKGILEKANKLLELIKKDKTVYISFHFDGEMWKESIALLISIFDFVDYDSKELATMMNILVILLEIVVLFTENENQVINMNWFLVSFERKMNRFFKKSFPFDLNNPANRSFKSSGASINLKACHACILLFPSSRNMLEKVASYVTSNFTLFYNNDDLPSLLKIISLMMHSWKLVIASKALAKKKQHLLPKSSDSFILVITKELVKKMLESYPSSDDPSHPVLFKYIVKEVICHTYFVGGNICKNYDTYKDLKEITVWIANVVAFHSKCPKAFIPTYVDLLNCLRAHNIPCFYDSVQENLDGLIDFMFSIENDSIKPNYSQKQLASVICDKSTLTKDHFLNLVAGSGALHYTTILYILHTLTERVTRDQGLFINGNGIGKKIDDSDFISFLLFFITGLNAERINTLSELQPSYELSVIATEDIIKEAENNLIVSTGAIYSLLKLPLNEQSEKLVGDHMETLFNICRPMSIATVCAFLHLSQFYEQLWNERLIQSVIESLLLITKETFNLHPLTDSLNVYLEEFLKSIKKGQYIQDILAHLIKRTEDGVLEPSLSCIIITAQIITKLSPFDNDILEYYNYLVNILKNYIPVESHWIFQL